MPSCQSDTRRHFHTSYLVLERYIASRHERKHLKTKNGSQHWPCWHPLIFVCYCDRVCGVIRASRVLFTTQCHCLLMINYRLATGTKKTVYKDCHF